jgi:hypothetical protein
MHGTVGRWLTVLLVLASAATAAADPIRIYDNRYVQARFDISDESYNEVAREGEALYAAAPWSSSGRDRASGLATLNSGILDPRHLAGMGSTEARMVTPEFSASKSSHAVSVFAVTIELDSPHTFSFRGIFDSSGTSSHSGRSEGVWGAHVSPTYGGPYVFLHSFPTTPGIDSGPHRVVIAETGLLTPGLWSFLVGAAADVIYETGSARAGFDFSFDLAPAASPVPEPGSIALLGSGLLILVRRARGSRAGRTRSAEAPASSGNDRSTLRR